MNTQIVSIRDHEEYTENLETLEKLLGLRETPRSEIDQRYLTVKGITNRLDVLNKTGHLDDKRVLMIGDADLTGLGIATFGTPSEVVVADIDNRLSEIYFEANLEYDLQVRYLYHDMRIKIIAILKNQYTLVVAEPPRTKAGVEVFISRGVQILDEDNPSGLFVTIPNEGPIRQFFDNYVNKINLDIVKIYPKIIEYENEDNNADFVQLKMTPDTVISHKKHWTDPFYEEEIQEPIHRYKCSCDRIIEVGQEGEYSSIEQLKENGCTECGYTGIFPYQSEIELQ